jgi:hypothetical protein
MRERDRLNLRGLLPPIIADLETQMQRVYYSYQRAGASHSRDRALKRKKNEVSGVVVWQPCF